MATTQPHLPHDTTRPPACSWRGLLVDSARTFWPVPTMELLLSVMARYRFNVLHWHLTDDTGWRMRVPGYPMLTAIGGNIPRQPSDWYDTECAPGRKGHGASRRPTRPKVSTQTPTFVTSSTLQRRAISASSPTFPSPPTPEPRSAHIPTWETPPSSIRLHTEPTRHSGPAPPLSASSKPPSIMSAPSSPPQPSTSGEHRPTGGHGNPIPP